MFKKIVSNLPFSPALVGQLGFYAKRLRQEETTRRLALIFVALALVIQSLAVFQPSESANASSPSDMVNGGIGQSINNFLKPYDANTKNLKDVMNYIGITRQEIAASKYSSWIVKDQVSWGFGSHFSYAQGERQYNITDSSGKHVTTIYSRPLSLRDYPNNKISGWVGYSQKVGWFGIQQECGNLVTDVKPEPKPVPNPAPKPIPTQPTVTPEPIPAPAAPAPATCSVNPQLLASNEKCKPCPGSSTIWIDDQSCIPNIVKTKSATNSSQGFINATTTTAKSGDRISYTIDISNTGLSPTLTPLEDNITDVLEYAEVVDNGGGSLNKDTGIMSWPDITLNPNDKQTRTFVVRVFDSIPNTAQGASNSTSFDCIITNTFGNSTAVNIDCPTVKVVEQIATELPKTGPAGNIMFACLILATAAYFFARTRQLEKEIYIIRKNTNAGTI